MKLRLLTVIVSTAALLSGCVVMAPGHLYPIQGPAAAQNPPAIYPLTLSGMIASGTMSATLENNESCAGNWGRINSGDNTIGQMSAQWDQVYGQGFFVANILGSDLLGRSALTCKQGTTLNIDFLVTRPGDVTSVKGVGQDSKGNVYKVTF